MTEPNDEKTFGKGYSKEDWDSVDSPEMTEEELASLRPAKDVLPPEFFAAMSELRELRRASPQNTR
jgi:uncharacterized protein (DUF4415 family)